MRLPPSRPRAGSGVNLTPMIDIVFLLVIFFLVSSHLARQETRLPLDLPAASTPGPADPERAALTITVDPGQRWLVGGRVVDLAGLRAVLADHVRREGDTAAVRVRTDRAVAYRRIAPVLGAAAQVGIVDLTLAVTREDP